MKSAVVTFHLYNPGYRGKSHHLHPWDIYTHCHDHKCLFKIQTGFPFHLMKTKFDIGTPIFLLDYTSLTYFTGMKIVRESSDFMFKYYFSFSLLTVLIPDFSWSDGTKVQGRAGRCQYRRGRHRHTQMCGGEC